MKASWRGKSMLVRRPLMNSMGSIAESGTVALFEGLEEFDPDGAVCAELGRGGEVGAVAYSGPTEFCECRCRKSDGLGSLGCCGMVACAPLAGKEKCQAPRDESAFQLSLMN